MGIFYAHQFAEQFSVVGLAKNGLPPTDKIRISPSSSDCLAVEFGDDLVADVGIRVDVLHVVRFFEGID